jgi:hypothetical protein
VVGGGFRKSIWGCVCKDDINLEFQLLRVEIILVEGLMCIIYEHGSCTT